MRHRTVLCQPAATRELLRVPEPAAMPSAASVEEPCGAPRCSGRDGRGRSGERGAAAFSKARGREPRGAPRAVRAARPRGTPRKVPARAAAARP